jgi:hypothetical protein
VSTGGGPETTRALLGGTSRGGGDLPVGQSSSPRCSTRSTTGRPESSGTATSLHSEDVLDAETFEAQQVMSTKAAFWDSLPPDQQLAQRELQLFLQTDSGITPDEAERTRELVEFLKSE